MKSKTRLLVMLGASAFILGSATVVTNAAASKTNTEFALFNKCQQLGPKNEVECACNTALSSNTAVALEAFSRLYKDDANLGITACAALAQVPVPPIGNDHSTPIKVSASPQ